MVSSIPMQNYKRENSKTDNKIEKKNDKIGRAEEKEHHAQ
jgi:hypothetical protein